MNDQPALASPAGVRVTLRGGEFVVVAILGPGDAGLVSASQH